MHPDFINKFKALAPNLDAELVIYCHMAAGLAFLGNALIEQLGYTNVSHLSGGITAWSQAGEPTSAK